MRCQRLFMIGFLSVSESAAKVQQYCGTGVGGCRPLRFQNLGGGAGGLVRPVVAELDFVGL